jgi:NADPH-dependent curcumin reductase
MANSNRQVQLKSRPVGIPQAQHFAIVETAAPEPKERQFVVRNEFLSVDPAMRGWVNAAQNYATPVAIGEVMRSYASGTVAASRHPRFKEGDKVTGSFGWQELALSDGAGVRKVRETDLPLSLSLGVLGLNGITAYFGLLDLGLPRAGDTVVVSTAAGAVGSAVGQIAKLMGCRTVGLTGGPVKTALCREEFGYDDAIDYKAGDLGTALAQACPRGVDVYFDNTAGPISDAVLPLLATGARVVICGRLGCQLGSAADGPARRTLPAGQARAHVGAVGVRLSAALRGSGDAARRLGARGRVALPRGHRRGHRARAGRHRRALSRRKPRQAAHPSPSLSGPVRAARRARNGVVSAAKGVDDSS